MPINERNPYRIDPLYLRMTLPRNTNDNRSSLPSVQDLFGALSQTSQFKVTLFFTGDSGGSGVDAHLGKCGLFDPVKTLNGLKYEFMCNSAILPGATFGTFDEAGSRQGVIEKFPTIRQFPEFTLEFYVDAEYDIIRVFEEWMNYINPLYVNGSITEGNPAGTTSAPAAFDSSNFYRMKYPSSYKRKIAITKFERDIMVDRGNVNGIPTMLTYEFVNAFPTNLTALPVSYEGSTITKTSVSFSYDRYVVLKHIGNTNRTQTPPVTKSGQRILNSSDSPTTGSPTGQDLVNLAYNIPPLLTSQ